MLSALRLSGSVAVRLPLLPPRAPLPEVICRHASRNNKDWTGSSLTHSFSDNRYAEQNDVSEEDLDRDEVESKMEALLKEARIKKKSAKFHKIRREMSSYGAPERRLSWDAIQQIRFLKQESPQEWTLQRLAEGFSVNTDVISRVLRSKFAPPPERRLKQDTKVFTSIGQLPLKDCNMKSQKGQLQMPLSSNTAPTLISSGNTKTVISLTSGAVTPVTSNTGLVQTAANIQLSSVRAARISAVVPGTLAEQTSERPEPTDVIETAVEMEQEEVWDGVVLTDERLEELIHTLQEKPSKVEQKGTEFYDSNGNFLYGI